jgi:hypothetical protein
MPRPKILPVGAAAGRSHEVTCVTALTARAGSHRFRPLGAPRALANAPHRTDSRWRMLRARGRRRRARTVEEAAGVLLRLLLRPARWQCVGGWRRRGRGGGGECERIGGGGGGGTAGPATAVLVC